MANSVKIDLASGLNEELVSLCERYCFYNCFFSGQKSAALGVVADWLEDHGDPRAAEVRGGVVDGLLAELCRAEWNYVLTPADGRRIKVDGWRYDTCMFSQPAGEPGTFRILSQHGGSTMPCNVRVTGRTLQRRGECHWVRVEIEFVGAGQESQLIGGWMHAPNNNRTFYKKVKNS